MLRYIIAHISMPKPIATSSDASAGQFQYLARIRNETHVRTNINSSLRIIPDAARRICSTSTTFVRNMVGFIWKFGVREIMGWVLRLNPRWKYSCRRISKQNVRTGNGCHNWNPCVFSWQLKLLLMWNTVFDG